MNKRKKEIFIFTAAEKKIGYGHYKRSYFLKKNFQKLNYKTTLVKLENNKKDGINYINEAIKKETYIIFDFSNRFFFKKNIFIKFVKKKINIIKNNLLVIDSFNKDSLKDYLKIKKLNYICPYFYEKKKLDYKYFIFNEKLKKLKKNKIKNIKCILITFGGSDLSNSSIKFLRILKKYNNIKIKVILGPFFDKNQILNIKKIKKNHKNIFLFKFKKNIIDLIKNSDLIITSTGLTKYELCLTNKHVVVYANNKNNYLVNENFKNKNIAIHFSYKDKQTLIKNKLSHLINYPFKYNHIIKNRIKFFDFKGPLRILKLLNENSKKK